ncbi:MAG: hypothetical protein LUE12_04925 [Ruminococcus sp.]|nr:hypothetical protein [Ruminococcus sp.]
MKKLSKPTKIAIFIVLIAALIFGIVSLAWLIRYHILFDPYIENDNFAYYNGSGAAAYTYETNSVCVDLNLPTFLKFQGSISSITTSFIDDNGNIDMELQPDFNCRFIYDIKLFGESNIYWGIQDYEAYADSTEVGGPTIITDTELNLIEYYPDEGLSELTYEDCYEDMKEYYNTYIVAVCNNDTFKKIE